MSNKHKGHVYGKKKKPQEELEDIFASLDLNTSSPENRRKGEEQVALYLQHAKS